LVVIFLEEHDNQLALRVMCLTDWLL